MEWNEVEWMRGFIEQKAKQYERNKDTAYDWGFFQ